MTSFFHYQNNQLTVEQVSLSEIAKMYGTPCYVYSKAALLHSWQAFHTGLKSRPHQICYAVKANSNLAILHILNTLGSGFDIVSQGELERVLAAGGNPKKIIFSGVGKTTEEIMRALQVNIRCFNIESTAELLRINEIAKQLNVIAKISLRINPNIDAKTHRHITTGLSKNKFGLDWHEVDNVIMQQLSSLKNIQLIGIGCHIGSQITTLQPFLNAIEKLLFFVDKLKEKNMIVNHLDIGGGLGVTYKNEKPPSITQYVTSILKKLSHFPGEIILEPGRALIANAGILLTKVEYIKQTPKKIFAIVDAAMNDLLRPALYQAWHHIMPVHLQPHLKKCTYDIVGPVCESADILGKNRKLNIQSGDLLAIHDVGAYGFSMSSNYNSRCRPAEIMVDGNTHDLIRPRETFQSLFATEKISS